MRSTNRKRSIRLAAQQDDTALPAPAHQPQRRLLPLPPMAGIRPVALGHHFRQCTLDVCRHAQAELIGQPFLLGTRHHRLDAPRHIAPQQRRPAACARSDAAMATARPDHASACRCRRAAHPHPAQGGGSTPSPPCSSSATDARACAGCPASTWRLPAGHKAA